MNHSNKPLTFSQEVQLEQYLYIMQELLSKPEQQHNPEVIQALEEASEKVTQFLTVEELKIIEEESLQFPENMIPPETIEFSLQLPRGWKADHFEPDEPFTQIDQKNKLITFSCIIRMKDPDER